MINGVTGWVVPAKSPSATSEAILEVLDRPTEAAKRVERGRRLVAEMFNVNRTAGEVEQIYRHVLGHSNESADPPAPFDAENFLRTHGRQLESLCAAGVDAGDEL